MSKRQHHESSASTHTPKQKHVRAHAHARTCTHDPHGPSIHQWCSNHASLHQTERSFQLQVAEQMREDVAAAVSLRRCLEQTKARLRAAEEEVVELRELADNSAARLYVCGLVE